MEVHVMSADPQSNSPAPQPQPAGTSGQVRKIPLSKIMANPDQPRKVMDEDKLTKLSDSMKEAGQQTAAKVRPLTPEEMAKYPGIEVMLLGGHRRFEAAKRAGLETLDCIVLAVIPEQGDLVALLDNKWEDMFWLDWDIAIEKMYNRASKTNQSKIAAILGVTQATISTSLKVAKALNAGSRDQIYKQLIILGVKGSITERPILALAELEDSEKVEKALPVLLKGQFTEPETKGLVQWTLAGNDPETFDPKKAVKEAADPNDPNAGLWEVLPKGFKVQLTPKGYKVGGTLSPVEAPLGVYGLFAKLEEAKKLQAAHIRGQANTGCCPNDLNKFSKSL